MPHLFLPWLTLGPARWAFEEMPGNPKAKKHALGGLEGDLGTIIGTWKLLGVAALALPRLPILKEWAYAGFFFDFTGAFASHAASADGFDKLAPPLILLAVLMGSYALRPSDRKPASR